MIHTPHEITITETLYVERNCTHTIFRQLRQIRVKNRRCFRRELGRKVVDAGKERVQEVPVERVSEIAAPHDLFVVDGQKMTGEIRCPLVGESGEK
jgi:hypothetical protein